MRTGWLVAVAVAATAVAAGCGDGGGTSPAPSSPAPSVSDSTSASAPASASAGHRLTVMSTAFVDGGTIPRLLTCDGENVSPPLAIGGVPGGTSSLAFTLQDSDAPRGTFTHWLVWDIDPHTTRLVAGEHPKGATEGRNDFRTTGYRGPCPPRGDRPHRYVLTVYATDHRPDLAPDATAEDLRRDLSGHTLASGTLTGRYGRDTTDR